MWKKRKIPASLSTVACNKAGLIQKSGPTVRAVRSKHPLELGDELRQLLGNTGKALKDLRRACEAKRWKRIRIILVLNTAEGCATSLATDKILQLIFPCCCHDFTIFVGKWSVGRGVFDPVQMSKDSLWIMECSHYTFSEKWNQGSLATWRSWLKTTS